MTVNLLKTFAVEYVLAKKTNQIIQW